MQIALELTSAISREEALVKGCLNEERWAQKQLYEQYFGKMMGVCVRYAGNEESARDVLNEGFIKVFKFLGRYQMGTSLEAWIKRIMVNTAIDYYRRNVRHKTEELETAFSHSVTEEDALSKCSAEEIMSCVRALPDSYRAVFNLFAIEGYNHKEVGEMLNITESTSRSHLVKARGKLQEMLLKKKK
jgi:RNA polymerase sigma factor (sigma-70 family)